MYTVTNKDGYAIDFFCNAGIFTCVQAENLARRINSYPHSIRDLEISMKDSIAVTYVDGTANVFTATNDHLTSRYYTVEIRNNKAAIQATTEGVLNRKQALSAVVQINEWVTFDTQLIAVEVRPNTDSSVLRVLVMYGDMRAREYHFDGDKAVDLSIPVLNEDEKTGRQERFGTLLGKITYHVNMCINQIDCDEFDSLLASLERAL